MAAATGAAVAEPREVAQPVQQQMPKAGDEATARVRYGDERAKAPGDQAEKEPAAGDGWVELASATPASHGREFISVDGGKGPLTALRLSAASGRPYISAVRIEMKDGTRKAFTVDKQVGRRPVQIDLHGARDIAQLVVVSDHDSTGAYIVEGKARPDGVASR
ncbi:MAG TPA: hypothetical protein VGC42_22075 [Kofleriaceae bacterium]